MKKLTLKITGGENDKMALFFDCGSEGNCLYDQAVEMLDDPQASDVEELVNGEAPTAEFFIPGLDDGQTSVSVEGEDGTSVFEDKQFKDGITSRGFITFDPRKWQFDKSVNQGLVEHIKELVSSQDEAIGKAIAEWENDHPGEPFSEDFVDENETLSDLADEVRSLIVKSPFVDVGFVDLSDESGEMLFAVNCIGLAENGVFQCSLELEDGEEFDPKQLKLIRCDYDGYYCECDDELLPVVMYKNKFYSLSRDSWDSRKEYYGLAKKEEGEDYFEFSGGYV